MFVALCMQSCSSKDGLIRDEHELEAGKQFSQRETIDLNLDRESYFINLGYQAFF